MKGLKNVFKQTRVKIATGLVVAVIALLGITYAVNPNLLKGLFGFSGEALMGDYVVKEGEQIPLYTHLLDLKAVEAGTSTNPAAYTMISKELFGLDAIIEENYARVIFYDQDMDKAWIGYTTKANVDGKAEKASLLSSVTVTFVSEGTTVSTQLLDRGSVATQPIITRNGYSLEGWYNGNTKWVFTSPVNDNNLVLSARWTTVRNEVTVTFNANGGSPTPPAQVIEKGTVVAQPTTSPAKANFRFVGWEYQPPMPPCPTDTMCIQVMPQPIMWDFSKPVDANMTLTAKYVDANVNSPVVNVTGNPTSWTANDVTLKIIATDDKGLAENPYNFSDGSGTAWTNVNTKTFTSNQTVKIQVRDYDGNITRTEIVINRIDKTKPSVPTWSLKTGDGNNYNGTWTKQNVILGAVTATDTGGAGIRGYQWLSGCTGTDWQPLATEYRYPLNGSAINGSYCIRAVDNAGNVSANSTLITIKVDQTVPTVTFTPNGSGSMVSPTCAGSDNDFEPIKIATNYGPSGRKSYLEQSSLNGGAFTGNIAEDDGVAQYRVPGQQQLRVTICNNVGSCSVVVSKAYYLDGPIIVARYNRTPAITKSQGSITATYTCQTGIGTLLGCDSKFSTLAGTKYSFELKSPGTNTKIGTWKTSLDWNATYQYLWVKANGSKCDTPSIGVNLGRVFK